MVALAAVASGVVYHLIYPNIPLLSRALGRSAPVYFAYMSLAEFALAGRARAYFSEGEALRSAWGWWGARALVRFLGFLLSYGMGYPRWREVVSGLMAGPWLLLDTIWLFPYTLSALAPALQVEASALALDSAALRALDEKHAQENDGHRE